MKAICTFLLFISSLSFADTYMVTNDIPPRYQWNSNDGYCGEVSLISAGLYYGQYVSQFDARATVCDTQDQCQILVGNNDSNAAKQLHLNFIEWNAAEEKNTPDFLAWVKQNVIKGYPVAIGIYTNEYIFYGKTSPEAGDPEYDHIVPVFAIGSNHSFTETGYYSDDMIYFSDNGLFGTLSYTPYIFSYEFGPFQATREQANAEKGPIYSLCDNGKNYGIAITGVMDLNGDTLPVTVATSVNYEMPAIADGSNTRPSTMPLTLTITISDLEPNVAYNLYRYNTLDSVPDSDFNAHAGDAYEHWPVEIDSGSTYIMTENITSNEIAVYRVVREDAP